MLEEHTRRQLKNNALEVTSMVHDRRPTLGEMSDALNKGEVGDWIEVGEGISLLAIVLLVALDV